MAAVVSDPQSRKGIDLVLGTMTIGGQVDAPGGKELINYFCEQGYNQLDTAIMYRDGETEAILGNILTPKQQSEIYIASKVNNTVMPDLALTRKSIVAQMDMILVKLKREYVNLLYLHWPDRKTPLEETLGAINELHKQGKFKEFGLSNYAAWEVAHVWHICKENNWVLPTVYQGMYNAITRDIEEELIPALRCFKMRFYVYNPLAGGLLTGKHNYTKGGAELEGRFKDNDRYVKRYWKEELFGAMKSLQETCEKHNLSLTEASLRWMRHHSKLIETDSIILGASKLEQLKENITYAKDLNKLPEEVVATFDEAWLKAKPVCEQYWR